MSYDGQVITGWGAIARPEDEATRSSRVSSMQRPKSRPHDRSQLCQFVIDVDNLNQGVAFWSAVLNAKEEPVSETSRHVYRRLCLPDSEVRVLLQATADTKTHKERMHLDLETNDVEAEVALP